MSFLSPSSKARLFWIMLKLRLITSELPQPWKAVKTKWFCNWSKFQTTMLLGDTAKECLKVNLWSVNLYSNLHSKIWLSCRRNTIVQDINSKTFRFIFLREFVTVRSSFWLDNKEVLSYREELHTLYLHEDSQFGFVAKFFNSGPLSSNFFWLKLVQKHVNTTRTTNTRFKASVLDHIYGNLSR